MKNYLMIEPFRSPPAPKGVSTRSLDFPFLGTMSGHLRFWKRIILFIYYIINTFSLLSQPTTLNTYNPTWTTQSQNSSESMPCGGGDIGLNVWVENNDIYFYIQRSGTFDENNSFLKLGRIKVSLTPNPFAQGNFNQELKLRDGYIEIEGKNKKLNAQLKIWVDVHSPVIHVDITSSKKTIATVGFENWRYQDRELRHNESFQNSYKWAPPKGLKTYKDEIAFDNSGILFYHKNKDTTIFDVTVNQQGLDSVKTQLYNPLHELTFGGKVIGENFIPSTTYEGKYLDTDFKGWQLESKIPSKNHEVAIYLHTDNVKSVESWIKGLNATISNARLNSENTFENSTKWWNNYWERSFIFINPDNPNEQDEAWQTGKNYQLFRYMLGCNAYGSYPTKFNGGLFTVDPRFTDSTRSYTPDYRSWGGGTFTAQNQRLVYFPMLKSGDFDMLPSQLNFYMRLLKNAELRSSFYWNHNGACFTEQLENFGLPNCSEYGWNRPNDYDKGMQYNNWLEYQWDTSLEFCLMMLELERYAGEDIAEYIPFIESNITFFIKHYKYLAEKRGENFLDKDGYMVIFPGSSCETYKMATNATSTVMALQTILDRLLSLPSTYLTEGKRKYWTEIRNSIPPLSYREINGKTCISPAKDWERLNNTESPQLYPVYPWGKFGVGKPGMDKAINTYLYDPDVQKFRSHVGWKQHNIFAARLGLTEEAKELTTLKLKNSDRRFPAFWGPGFDWVPDHNWGGSGMIGLQEMLLQENEDSIYLFPAWPKEWDVHFKLHAPHHTTIEVMLVGGEIKKLEVYPVERKKDIVIMNIE